jgi:hypothetical protein
MIGVDTGMKLWDGVEQESIERWMGSEEDCLFKLLDYVGYKGTGCDLQLEVRHSQSSHTLLYHTSYYLTLSEVEVNVSAIRKAEPR